MSQYIEKLDGIINEFNEIFGFKRRVIFRSIYWKKDSVGQVTQDVQMAINNQLLDDYDLMISLIGDRLGEVTARDISGTAEEIHLALDKKDEIFGGKHVQVLFRSRIDSDMRSVDPHQIMKVKDFQKSIQ